MDETNDNTNLARIDDDDDENEATMPIIILLKLYAVSSRIWVWRSYNNNTQGETDAPIEDGCTNFRVRYLTNEDVSAVSAGRVPLG